MALRLTFAIDDEHAALLTELADRTHAQAEAVASAMLMSALERAAALGGVVRTQAEGLVALRAIPGALDDHRAGLREISSGQPGRSIDEI